MSVILQFAMFPTDKGISVSPYVSQIVEMIAHQGFVYQLTPMATLVETETITEALDIVARAYALLEPESERVYVTASLDIRKGSLGRMERKIKSVEEKIKKRQEKDTSESTMALRTSQQPLSKGSQASRE